MGYTTDFEGRIEIEPALNETEIRYLNRFSETRRMDRENGPYFVGGNGPGGQDDGPDEIYNYNNPHPSQPGLWCQWVPTDDGTALEWNEAEKFYDAAKWMQYLMDHFIGSAPAAITKLRELTDVGDFLQGHACNGVISAHGEDPGDSWLLVVKDNQVYVQDLVLTASGELRPVATSVDKLLPAPLMACDGILPKPEGK